MAFHALGIQCPEDFMVAGTQTDLEQYAEPEFMDPFLTQTTFHFPISFDVIFCNSQTFCLYETKLQAGLLISFCTSLPYELCNIV